MDYENSEFALEHARSMAEDAIRCYIEGLQRLDEPPPVESDAVQLRLSVRVCCPNFPGYVLGSC